MARGQGTPKQPGAFGDTNDVTTNFPGTKEDRGMEPTPMKDRPGPHSTGSGRRRRRPGGTSDGEDGEEAQPRPEAGT